MAEQERPFAVVTGGSSGIGLALAREFAAHDFDLLIAAEGPERLASASAELASFGAKVHTHCADLGLEEGVTSLCATLTSSGRPVDVGCINAGIGLGGCFADTDLDRELRMIDLNVRGAVQLTKHLLRGMVARDSGRILFTSSIAASMPAPFEAVYGATKAFLRAFGEALRNELKDTGVGVTVLMPGVTDTDFFRRADMLDTRAGASENKDDPADVARAAFRAVMENRHKVTPGLKNKVLSATAEILPDPLAADAHRVLSKPGSGQT